MNSQAADNSPRSISTLRIFQMIVVVATVLYPFAALVSAASRPKPPAASPQEIPAEATPPLLYDLVIRNGRVMDPETKFDRTGMNVGILHGRVAAITSEPLSGAKEIDATGLVVAPGFIDLISYDPNTLGAWNKIADGVTTNLAMHGGAVDPAAWYAQFERAHTPVNFGASFFYWQARTRLGVSRYRAATAAQIAQLQNTAETALQKGALGISFSLEYCPGTGPEEIVPLLRLAKQYDVPVFFHARYSTMQGAKGTNLDGLREIIGYARETGASVHIEHINSTGGTFSMKESLRMLAAAREEGLDITADTYPYDYWGTYLNSARFDEGWQKRFRISYPQLQLGGSPERLTEESFRRYQKQGKLAVAYAIPEEDVIEALRSPFVIIGSDAILEGGHNNHPRASGAFARTIGLYVREKGIISLMDALAKMSLMPAQRMEKSDPSFLRKGRLSVGADADIVVFNYETIRDTATVEHPEYPSAGIEYVLVGGSLARTPVGNSRQLTAARAMRGDRATQLAAKTAAGPLSPAVLP